MDRRLEWTVETVATLQSPDGELTPVPWGFAIDARRRLIAIVDATGHRVAVFGADGQYRHAFGGPGDGPREFRSPWALSVRSDGTLSVVDVELGRIAHYTFEGDWLGSQALPTAYFGPHFADQGDHLIMVTTREPAFSTEQRLDLSVVGGDAVRQIASTVQELKTANLPCGSRGLPVPKPLAPEPIWTVHGDTILVTSGREYAIDVYRGSDTVGRVARPIAPVDVTEEMAVERIASGQLHIFMEMCGMSAAEVAAGIDWRETVSPVQRIAVAPDGRLWVTRVGPSQRNYDVDVLDQRGTYIGTLYDVASPIAFVSADRFVGSRLDAMGGTTLEVVEVTDPAA